MSGQISSLTGLRAFAAALVLTLHYNQAFGGVDVDRWLPFVLFGYVGVDVFFVLSGYILAHVYQTRLAAWDLGEAGRFLLLRLARIWPVHMAGLAVTVLIYFAGVSLGQAFSHPENWRLSHLVFHVTMTHAWFIDDIALWNTPSWSISAEFFAYLCLPLGLPLVLRRKVAAAVAAAAVAGIVLLYWPAGIDLASAYKGWPAIARVMTEFWLGAAAFVLVRGMPPHPAFRLLPAAAIAMILLAGSLDFPDWTLILWMPALLIGLHKGGSVLFASRPLVYLGRVSYSVYIVHFPVQLALMQAYGRLGGDGWGIPLQLLWYAAAMAVAVAAGIAMFHLVEHPAREAIRRRATRAFRPTAPELGR